MPYDRMTSILLIYVKTSTIPTFSCVFIWLSWLGAGLAVILSYDHLYDVHVYITFKGWVKRDTHDEDSD